jgi:hypothetical protein
MQGGAYLPISKYSIPKITNGDRTGIKKMILIQRWVTLFRKKALIIVRMTAIIKSIPNP